MSHSAAVLGYLKKLAINTDFTNEEICVALGVSDGAVSGFVNRLIKAGQVRIVGKRNRAFVYQLTQVPSIEVRNGEFKGSTAGRTVPYHQQAHPPKLVRLHEHALKLATRLEQLSGEMLSLAMALEHAEPDLNKVSMEDLVSALYKKQGKKDV